jgi:D-alanyl-D-alanine carboxypeptidase
MPQPYIIFFRGLDGLIDESAAKRLASNRGCEAIFFSFGNWNDAALHVKKNPDTPYHIVGFSRGASPATLASFMATVRQYGYRLPEDIMTVGLYGPIGGTGITPRYRDPVLECVNFLDESGQAHLREHDPVHYRNLGAHVPHLGPGSGMELVADMFADGKNPLSSPAPSGNGVTQPAPQPAASPARQAGGATILTKQNWPTQAGAAAFYGTPGSHLTHVPCPWVLHMDKDIVKAITIHEKCAASLTRVLAWVWETCGKDPEKIAALRYDRFSGSYNYRPMRGGSTLSMHAYGAAIDWDDADNAQHSHKHLFTAESALIKAFLDEGWEWGGNWSGGSIDAMHVQAAHVR